MALALFSISMVLFQLSCKEESVAQTSAGLKQLNKIVFSRYDYAGNKPDGIYIANYDGSGMTKVNIVIPGMPTAYPLNPKLSPDGQTLFFHAGIAGNHSNIFSCNIDGTNVKKVLDGGADLWEFSLGGAY